MPDDSLTFYDQTVSNDLEEHLEEPAVEPESALEPEPEPEPEPEARARAGARAGTCADVQENKPEPALEEAAPGDMQKSAPLALADMAPAQEDLIFSWASVTENLPPSGVVPVMGIPPPVVKVTGSQPCPESKPNSQIPPQRSQRDQRVREQQINISPQRGPRPIREAGETRCGTSKDGKAPSQSPALLWEPAT